MSRPKHSSASNFAALLQEFFVERLMQQRAVSPQTIASYRDKAGAAGFAVSSVTDLTDEWQPILRERLAMYQALREEARSAGTPMGRDAFHQSYIRFVALIQQRKLGGARLVAEKPMPGSQ